MPSTLSANPRRFRSSRRYNPYEKVFRYVINAAGKRVLQEVKRRRAQSQTTVPESFVPRSVKLKRKSKSSKLKFQGYGVMPKTKFATPNTKLKSLTTPFGIVSHGPKFKSKQLNRINKRFDQKGRMTVYYCEPTALDSSTGIIKKMEPIQTNSSVDVNHAYNIVQNCTFCPDADYVIGNQRMPAAKAQAPIYTTNGDGSNLVPGLVQSDSTKYPIITNTHIPRSAELESKPFQIPTHVWSSCKIKLQFKNTCASAQRISLKLVRAKETFGFNVDLNLGSMIGPVQQLTNHYKITDKENWDTLWSYNAHIPGLCPNRKQSIINVNKTVFGNYMRSTLHRNSQAENPADDKLGGQLLPAFKQTNESYNSVFLVISILQDDDKVVKFVEEARPLTGETSTTAGWNAHVDPEMMPVTLASNRVQILGYVSNKFRFSDVYSRTEAAQMSLLQSQLDTMLPDDHDEHHANDHHIPASTSLEGDWNINGGPLYFTLAFAPPGSAYQYTMTRSDGSTTNSGTAINKGTYLEFVKTGGSTLPFWFLDDSTMQSGTTKLTKQ